MAALGSMTTNADQEEDSRNNTTSDKTRKTPVHPSPLGPGKKKNNNNILESAQCKIRLVVGRVPGTAMPPEWAASGAKLVLDLDVEFTNAPCAEYEMNQERILQGSSVSGSTPSNSNTNAKNNYKAVVPLTEPTFISTQGTEVVPVTSGAYSSRLEQNESQLYSCRFFLDFPDGAIRNDVVLPSERIYFLTQYWRLTAARMNQARQQKDTAVQQVQALTTELNGLEEAAITIFQKVLQLRRTTILVEQRRALQKQITRDDQLYPIRDGTEESAATTLNAGSPAPPLELIAGPSGTLFPKQGMLAVKRYRGTLQTQEQYHWIGTFTMEEFSADL